MTKKITHSSGWIPSVLNGKFKLLVLAAAFVTAGLQAQTVTTITTPGAGTFTVPANVATMTVECRGGGGAGGSTMAWVTVGRANTVGGGGAGGSFSKATIPTPTAGTYDYTVGAGAIAVTQASISSGAVSNGGSSFFNYPLSTPIVLAIGGLGGQSASDNTTTGYLGLGGAKISTGNTGTGFYGGSGANAVIPTTTLGSGGGGGSAGDAADGGNASGITGGAAGTAGGATGTNGYVGNAGNAAGANAPAPGAGGSGSKIRAQNMAALVYQKGGDGGNGQIKISYIFNEPTAQATDVNFTSIATDGMTINWTNGNADVVDGITFGRAVFVKEGTGSITLPVDGTAYTASTDWTAKGTQLGTSGYYCVYNGTGSTVSLTLLNPATTYTVYVYEYSISGSYKNFETTGVSATQATNAATSPFITVSTTSLTAFANTMLGDYSAEKTYTVEGINLTDGGITVTAPTGFKVSKTSGSGFASSVLYEQSGGTVTTQTVYVRLEPTAIQAFSGNIDATSTDATTRSTSVSGTGTDPKPSISIISPLTNSTAGTGASVVLTATAIPTGSRTISANDVVFSDGAGVISGTVTKSGNDFSITYTVPAGSNSITAVATDNQSNAATSAAIVVKGVMAHTGNKYAQSAITSWVTGPWYDAVSGGNEVTYPAAGDNVYTNGFAVVANANAVCDNLTFLVAAAGNSVANQLKVNAGSTLTVRGTIDGSNAPADATTHILYDPAGTGTIKLTGEVLTSPFTLIGDNAIGADLATDVVGMFKPVNLVIEAVNTANTYQFGGAATTLTYYHGTGKFSVKSGTILNVKPTLILNQGVDNELIVEENATLTANNHIKGSSSNFSNITKATINGTLSNIFYIGVKDLVVGTNGVIKSGRGTAGNASYVTYEGWWGTATSITSGASFGTPNSVTLGSNSTIEFDKTGDQNLNGIVPANGSSPTAQYSIPYANLKLLGSGIKTLYSNLTFTGTLTVATGVTMVISSGVTLTIPTSAILNVAAGGKITNEGTIVNGGTINYLSDATNGTATYLGAGTISGAGTVNVNQSLQHPTSALRSWYVSSPVAETVAPTPTLTSIKTFNETANTWSAVSLTQMEVGKGYIVLPANAANNLLFTGTLNTGNQDIIITGRDGVGDNQGFNLVGNPYPSYLDWSEVAPSNGSSILRSSSMWYRTKDAGVYSFWTVNGAGVGTPATATKEIPPMQAFWVRAAVGGSTLALRDSMRVHAPASNKLLKAPALNERILVRLQVSNGVNTDEAVIYFSENAQNGLDMLDAPKMSNNNVSIPEIYTMLGTEKIVINSMNNMPMNTSIGLGFVAGNASTFSIKANEVSNFPEGVKVLLRDNVTLAETDLTDGTATYSFAPAATNTDRFSVIFRSAGNATGVNDRVLPTAQVFVTANNQIMINTFEKSNYAIYNAVGQLLENGVTTSNFQTANCKLNAGMYVVKINALTTKVIIKK